MTTRNYKDLRIDQKLGLFFLLAAFIILLNLTGVVYFFDQQDIDNAVINTSGRNRALSQQVALYAERVRDAQPAKRQLRETIALLDHSIEILRSGGIPHGFAHEIELPPTPDDILPVLIKAKAQWRPFKLSANIILERPLTIDTVGLEEYYGADSLIYTRKRKYTVPNPDVVQSLAYMDANSELLMASFNELVKAYVQHAESKRSRMLGFLLFLLALSIGLSVAWVHASRKFLKKPAGLISEACSNLAEGNIQFDASYDTEDEIGSSFKNLKRLAKNITAAANFAESIGHGQFDHQYKPAGENDRLGYALIKMRKKLKEIGEQDRKRNWVTEGLTKFADILRSGKNEKQNANNLYNHVIQSLVKYVDANQGGIFVLNTDNESDPVMELKAAYAWSRKKFLEKTIPKGTGLVGQAWVEEEMIYLEDVPSDYVNISSGLGDANPKSVVILPLKVNDNIYGILELAAFTTFESFKIDFLQQLSEIIASAISSARTNERTTDLLERSQQQTEELRAQEEEMRQNMEELAATQEEMQRKSIDTEARVVAIERSGIASIEFDASGMILHANQAFCKLMHYTLDEITGYHHSIFVENDYAESDEYKSFWKGVVNGSTPSGEYIRKTKLGNKVYLYGAYTVIRDTNDEPIKIVKFVTNITPYIEDQQALINQNLRLKEKIALN